MEKTKRILEVTARWLFILAMPVLLLTASLSLAMNSQRLYQYGFDKYEIGRVTGLEAAELEKASRGLIDYFNSGEEDIDITVIKDGQPFQLFNEREIIHLRDVKGLFRLNYNVLMGIAIYMVIFLAVALMRRRFRELGRGLFGGGVLTLGLMVVLGLAILVGFDQLFLQFHLLSFANDFWMLDPRSDYLLMMFPQGFWFDAALFCAIVAAVVALIFGGVGWWLKRRYAG